MSTSPHDPCACKDIAIVVVDDEATFRTALAENLRDDGHPVRDYADPLAVGALDGIDLVITDYDMESMNGLAFADMIHAAHATIGIVLITAYWTAELESALTARPFVRVQRKPLDYDVVHTDVHA